MGKKAGNPIIVMMRVMNITDVGQHAIRIDLQTLDKSMPKSYSYVMKKKHFADILDGDSPLSLIGCCVHVLFDSSRNIISIE